jgi:SPRY domain
MFVLKESNHTSRVAAGGIGIDIFSSNGNGALGENAAQEDKDAAEHDAIMDMALFLEWEKIKKTLNIKDGTAPSEPSSNNNDAAKIIDDLMAADPLSREISDVSIGAEKDAQIKELDISMDDTEVSDATAASFVTAVVENAKLLQEVTERAKSFAIDHSKLVSGIEKVQVPINNALLPGVRFTGAIGTGSRSVIANQPLPKPEAILPVQVQTDLVSVSDASSVVSAASKRRKPKMLKRMFRSRSKLELNPIKEVVVPMNPAPPLPTPEPIKFKPFVSPFKLPDGTVSVTPRMVSYYEVEIVPFVEDLDDTSQESSTAFESDEASSKGEEDKEEKQEDTPVVNESDVASKEVQVDEAPEVPTEDPDQPPVASADEEVQAEPASDDDEEKEEEVDDDFTECVAIGLSTSGFRMSCRMPGWDQHSVGYHGDDGTVFYRRQVEKSKFGPAFMAHLKDSNETEEETDKAPARNIIGCGIDYEKNAVFFTRNGEFLGYAVELPENHLVKSWWPTVGVDSRASVVCNFGYDRPFAFDLQGHIEHGSTPVVPRPVDTTDKISEVSQDDHEESQ